MELIFSRLIENHTHVPSVATAGAIFMEISKYTPLDIPTIRYVVTEYVHMQFLLLLQLPHRHGTFPDIS